ncbi:MAG: DsrE family protein [Saprospiraceae bacterium]|nr:DsrE family protein [Saprospiraceae bacterium]MBK7737657.1 DsrE family protein [Saprospiraceae bacterium]MBK7913759.1 DsrE family protein [Saprospiraceae bacterium]
MKNALLFSCLLLCGNFLKAQSAPYNVVFDVTSKDTIVHQMVIRWIKEITNTAPDANIEVVFYAKSMDMITTGNSVVSNDVIKFAAKKNVAFKVCEVALKNNALDKSQLLPGVQTVPDGIYEIISRQHEGWGYIKAAR